MKVDLTHGVKYIIDALYDSGFEAYTVGGAVRNSLLDLPVDDYDITTSASPSEVKEVFKHLRTIDTGIKHGTVTVLYEGTPYEVTTYRLDGEYGDNRHPMSVEFTRSLENDLARRDFTINAMCYNDRAGLVDLYGGKTDLEAKVIRTVGEADRRFTEDALRILRALRFASVLDFAIDYETSQAIFKLYSLLANVSNERILVEVKKLLSGIGAHRIITEYAVVMRFVFLELSAVTLPESERFLSADWRARLCSLFLLSCEDGADALDSALRRLRSDNKTRGLLVGAVRAYFSVTFDSDPDILRGLMRFDSDVMALCADIIYLVKGNTDAKNALSKVLSKNPAYRISDLAISGSDLQALGYLGTQIGKALEHALNAVIDGECANTYEALTQLLRK